MPPCERPRSQLENIIEGSLAGTGAASQVSLSLLGQFSSNQIDLTELLERVADFSVRAFPAATGAGLTLIEARRPDLSVATSAFVANIDAVQHSLEEGPSVTSSINRDTIVAGSLASDERWPNFGPRAAQLGVHSALAIPLTTPAGLLGTLRLYAQDLEAFGDDAASTVQLVGVPAAITLETALILDQTRRLAKQLQSALDTRSVIEQAIGVIRARDGMTHGEAFQVLRRMSQNRNVKAHTVAEGVLAQAEQQARRRIRQRALRDSRLSS